MKRPGAPTALWRLLFWGFAIPVVVMVPGPTICGWAATTLADRGRSRYHIVIPSNAISSERYAAEELQRYLEAISGAKLPIVPDTEPIDSREVLVGDNARRSFMSGTTLSTSPITSNRFRTSPRSSPTCRFSSGTA